MGDQMSELRRLEMQNELRETDGDLGQNNKRKERAGTDAGEQKEKLCGFNPLHLKKQKFIHADDLQNETSEAVPNTEEANNERKEPTEIKKNGEGSEEMDPELVRIMEELDDCFPAFEYEFDEQDFLPWESVGESLRHHHQFLLSPQESSNKNVAAQPQMQTHGPSDELRMLDGISLADLRNDLQEGQGSTSDLDKEENQERLDEIYFDLANVLKP